MSNKSSNDAYYTNPSAASAYVSKVLGMFGGECTYIEPSAGAGAFSTLLPNCTAYDTHPAHPNILEGDFLSVGSECIQGSVVVGNPPFGKNSSLAIKMFNHAAVSGALAICFILPRTFRKFSVQNRLNKQYHLILDEDVPYKSFLLNDEPYDVPCVFQVWERRCCERSFRACEDSGLFATTHDKALASLFVRRVGGRAGEIVSSDEATKSSTYWLKCDASVVTSLLLKALPKIKIIRDNTAGVRSISLPELHRVLLEVYEKSSNH